MHHKAAAAVVISLLLLAVLPGCISFDNQDYRFTAPGDWAEDFLTDEKFDKLIIEINYVEGYAPSSAAVSLLKQRILERCYKSEVEITMGSIPSGGSVYTIEDVRGIEDLYRQSRNRGSTLTLHFLYLDGSYSEDTDDAKVLGAAYRASSLVIFKNTIAGSGGNGVLKPTKEQIENSVVVHELGHILGLVNMGTKMVKNHEDNEHPHHTTNKSCVMYWAVESSAIVNLFVTGGTAPPTQFGAECMADLKNNRGK